MNLKRRVEVQACSEAAPNWEQLLLANPLEQTDWVQTPLRQQVIDWLADQVPQPRLQHILRVETTASQLAQHHGLAVELAAQAGLLHDLAKYFEGDRLLAIAQAQDLPLDPVDEVNPHLLHAAVSAVVARDQFQIQDQEVLAAIRHHTLGAPEMSLLSCVVFLADGIEPGRGDRPHLLQIREACLTNLHQAVMMLCDRTLQHLIEHSGLIHPQMVLTRNWAFQEAQPAQGQPDAKLCD